MSMNMCIWDKWYINHQVMEINNIMYINMIDSEIKNMGW